VPLRLLPCSPPQILKPAEKKQKTLYGGGY
jgi:hypothetical protein